MPTVGELIKTPGGDDEEKSDIAFNIGGVNYVNCSRKAEKNRTKPIANGQEETSANKFCVKVENT